MASLPSSLRPAMGRYTLLPSASNLESVSEEAERGLPVVEGMNTLVLFDAISRDFE